MNAPAKPTPGVSVFFPAYNDSGTIASLVITALKTARRLTDNFEIIIVNDGSADRTAEIADELARAYRRSASYITNAIVDTAARCGVGSPPPHAT